MTVRVQCFKKPESQGSPHVLRFIISNDPLQYHIVPCGHLWLNIRCLRREAVKFTQPKNTPTSLEYSCLTG